MERPYDIKLWHWTSKLLLTMISFLITDVQKTCVYRNTYFSGARNLSSRRCSREAHGKTTTKNHQKRTHALGDEQDEPPKRPARKLYTHARIARPIARTPRTSTRPIIKKNKKNNNAIDFCFASFYFFNDAPALTK